MKYNLYFFIVAFLSVLLASNASYSQCNRANWTNSTSGALGGVSNPANAYNNSPGDVSTYAALSIYLFVGGGTLNVDFDKQINQGDSIIVLYGAPGFSIIDWASLGNISFQPFSGADGTGTGSSQIKNPASAFIGISQVGNVNRLAVPVDASQGAASIQISLTALGFVINKQVYVYDVSVVPGQVSATGKQVCYSGGTSTITSNYNAVTPVDVTLYDSDGTTVINTFQGQTGYYSIPTPFVRTSAAPKTFYMTQNWSNSNCSSPSNISPVQITLRPQILPSIGVTCASNSSAPSTLRLTSATNASQPISSYLWSGSNGGFIYSGDETKPNPRIPNQPGTYTLTITDANGCQGTITQTITPGNSGCSVLPVTLDNFTIRAANCNAILNWRGAIENNFSYYEVQISTDGSSFVPVGKVYGKGSGNGYTFQYPLSENVEYIRLKMVDNNNAATYSATLQVNSNCNNLAPGLYPNPTSGSFTISGLGLGNKDILINAVNGALVYKGNTSNTQVTINAANWAPGIYFVKISAERKVTKNVIVVKK